MNSTHLLIKKGRNCILERFHLGGILKHQNVNLDFVFHLYWVNYIQLYKLETNANKKEQNKVNTCW